MKRGIIIFVRNPELGKVKTRLAKEIGDEKTLQVYISLLKHTHDVSIALDCEKFVFYSDEITENDLWENKIYQKRLQAAGDLGAKMQQSFLELFNEDFEKVVIIGSDCPELSVSLIDDAFSLLNTNDAVIGPAKDGGYYLLGLNGLIPGLFTLKEWSTATVLIDTLGALDKSNASYSFLPPLTDIDTWDDLVQLNYSLPD